MPKRLYSADTVNSLCLNPEAKAAANLSQCRVGRRARPVRTDPVVDTVEPPRYTWQPAAAAAAVTVSKMMRTVERLDVRRSPLPLPGRFPEQFQSGYHYLNVTWSSATAEIARVGGHYAVHACHSRSLMLVPIESPYMRLRVSD